MMLSFGLLAGCASIIHGTQQTETIKSEPGGATIMVDNHSYGTTPKTVVLKRSRVHTVKLSLPGYQPASFKLTKHLSGWYFGNILFGGAIGLVVDAADGAIYQLKPGQATLNNGDKIQLGKQNTITVVMVKHLEANARLKKIGQLKARG